MHRNRSYEAKNKKLKAELAAAQEAAAQIQARNEEQAARMVSNYTCTDIEQQEAPKVWRHTNHYKFRYCHSYACTFMLFLICWL